MARKIKFDKDLIEILLTPSFDNFTVLELRSAYLANSTNSPISKIEARRFVYRHIRRLEKKGLLQKKESSGGSRRVYYSKTKDLCEAIFEHQSENEVSSVKGLNLDIEKEVYSELQLKRSRYKSDLLITLGEMEEYRSLRERFPELADYMEGIYRQASEECSKVHGRIKAIEKLLTNHQSEIKLNATS